MSLQFVDAVDGRRELQKLIRRSVKTHKLGYGVLPENSGIEGIEGRPATVPLIAVRRAVLDDLFNTDMFIQWQSIGVPGDIHLFLTARTAKHEWLFHFEAQNKDHLDWLECFCDTSLRGPLGVGGERYGIRDGDIGITGFKDSDPAIHLPPVETGTVGMAILTMRIMSGLQSGIAPERGGEHDGR